MKTINFKYQEIGETVLISKKDWERIIKWLKKYPMDVKLVKDKP